MARIQWTSHRRSKAKRNLAWVYATLSPEQRERGLEWYSTANEWCRSEAMHTPFNLKQVAAIVAVTSPGNGWHANLADATAAMALHTAGVKMNDARSMRSFTCYPTCLERAWRIMDGEEPSDVVGGPKVTAFWHNLTGDESVATIDRHAITAAGFAPNEVELVQRRRAWFDGVQRQYEILADLQGISVAQAQACVWIAERENMKGHEAA